MQTYSSACPPSGVAVFCGLEKVNQLRRWSGSSCTWKQPVSSSPQNKVISLVNSSAGAQVVDRRRLGRRPSVDGKLPADIGAHLSRQALVGAARVVQVGEQLFGGVAAVRQRRGKRASSPRYVLDRLARASKCSPPPRADPRLGMDQKTRQLNARPARVESVIARRPHRLRAQVPIRRDPWPDPTAFGSASHVELFASGCLSVEGPGAAAAEAWRSSLLFLPRRPP